MEKQKKSPANIILSIGEWVLIVIAILFIAFIAIFASNKPTEKSSGSVFGYQTRLVVSGSMEAADSYYESHNYKIGKIKTGSVIFLKSAPTGYDKITSDKKYTTEFKNYLANIIIGDVVTFVPASGEVNAITHRVVNKAEIDGKVKFETRGDVADSEGSKLTESFYAENIEGKVVGTSYFVGTLYRKVFSNKPLMVTLILIPTAAIITVEGLKIGKIVKEDKIAKAKKKNEEESKE